MHKKVYWPDIIEDADEVQINFDVQKDIDTIKQNRESVKCSVKCDAFAEFDSEEEEIEGLQIQTPVSTEKKRKRQTKPSNKFVQKPDKFEECDNTKLVDEKTNENIKQKPSKRMKTPDVSKLVSPPIPDVSKLVSPPIPDVSKRLERVYSAVEYVKTLDIDFHKKVTEKLTTFFTQRNSYKTRFSEADKTPYISVVTGPVGCGKTFCVLNAVKHAKYDLVWIDALSNEDVDTHVRQALIQGSDPLGPNSSKRVRVVLIDAAEGMETSVINRVMKLVGNIVSPKDGARGKKKVDRFLFWLNPIVVTCITRHETKLRAFFDNPKTKTQELKCIPPKIPEIEMLLKKACLYIGTPFDKRVGNLLKSSSDVSHILVQTEYMTVYKAKSVLETEQTDAGYIDIFRAGKYLLQPKVNGTFEDYNLMWDRGGKQNMSRILFNSYPKCVSTVVQPDEPCQTVVDYKNFLNQYSNKEFYTKGLEELQELSDAHSVLNTVESQLNFTPDFADTFLRMSYYSVMKNKILNSKTPIDAKSRLLQGIQTPGQMFPNCLLDKAGQEKLRFVVDINTMQKRKILEEDGTYIVDPKYDPSSHIGHYSSLKTSETKPDGKNISTYVDIDLFSEIDDVKETGKKKKGVKREYENHARARAVKVFSKSFLETGISPSFKTPESLKPLRQSEYCLPVSLTLEKRKLPGFSISII
jgi:hypothetical protein